MTESEAVERTYLEANRRLWDGWTEIRKASPFYYVEAFLEGRSTLVGLAALVGWLRRR